MVEIEIGVLLKTSKVRNGLPRTRNDRRLAEGMSRVTLRSLNSEIICDFCENEPEFPAAETVKSALKTWNPTAELQTIEGYEIAMEERADLIR